MKLLLLIFLVVSNLNLFAQEEDFPIWKFTGFNRSTLRAEWNASNGYQFTTTGVDSSTSREFSPTNMNPFQLINHNKYWDGYLTITLELDTTGIYDGTPDTIYFNYQKKIGTQWVESDTIEWTKASATGTTVKLIPVNAYIGEALYFITDPSSSNTTRLIERHTSSIHRIEVVSKGAVDVWIKQGAKGY